MSDVDSDAEVQKASDALKARRTGKLPQPTVKATVNQIEGAGMSSSSPEPTGLNKAVTAAKEKAKGKKPTGSAILPGPVVDPPPARGGGRETSRKGTRDRKDQEDTRNRKKPPAPSKTSLESLRQNSIAVRTATDFERLVFAACQNLETRNELRSATGNVELAEICRTHWMQMKLRPGAPQINPPKAKAKAKAKEEGSKTQGTSEEKKKKSSKEDKDAQNKFENVFKNIVPTTPFLFDAVIETLENANSSLEEDEKFVIPKELRMTDQNLLQSIHRAEITAVWKACEAQGNTGVLTNCKIMAEQCTNDRTLTREAGQKEAGSGHKESVYPKNLNPTAENVREHTILRANDPLARHLSNNIVELRKESTGYENDATAIRNAYTIAIHAYPELAKNPEGCEAKTELDEDELPDEPDLPDEFNKKLKAAMVTLSEASASFHLTRSRNFVTTSLSDRSLQLLDKKQEGLADKVQDALKACTHGWRLAIPMPEDKILGRLAYGRASPLVCAMLHPSPERSQKFMTKIVSSWASFPMYKRKQKESRHPGIFHEIKKAKDKT
jgi:hypothetical protein